VTTYESELHDVIANPAGATAAERVTRLLDAQWARDLLEYPELAWSVGEPAAALGWTDLSPGAIDRRREHSRLRLKAARSISPMDLAGEADLDHRLFRHDSEIEADGVPFPNELLPLGQLSGPQQEVALSLSDMPGRHGDDYLDMLERLTQVPRLVAETTELMKRGVEAGIVAPRVTVAGVPEQIDDLLTADPLESGLAERFVQMPASISATEQERLRDEAASLLRGTVFPAFAQLREYLTETYLPASRESIALTALPDGDAWYAWRIREQTSTRLDAATIHQVGLDELARIGERMTEVMARAGYSDRVAFLAHLHNDPSFRPASAESVVAAYRALCKRIDPELPRLFGTLPWLPYGVLPMPPHAEKTAPAAYYLPGSVAAGRPGYFLANTYELDQRPTWEMVPLALHEAVPGHHLQFAVAQQLGDLHPWRRHRNETAYIEGWGLYAESLGHDIGFYDDPYDEFGSLVFEAWRAARLVVDTGMHALGWTRQQAIDFMGEKTGKPGHDVEVEVDRYIEWPGQALAYTLGYIRIRELRQEAESVEGNRFDLRAFHDEVLAHGPLPLDFLSEVVSEVVAGAPA
jgi:uncharacterized protein (DUF885 family)